MKSKILSAALGSVLLFGILACSKAPSEEQKTVSGNAVAPASTASTSAIATPDKARLKNLSRPETLCTTKEKRYVAIPRKAWEQWLTHFSGRSFSPSFVSFAPVTELRGEGYSINFHEKQLIINVDGSQFTCERTPEDEALLKSVCVAPRSGLSISR